MNCQDFEIIILSMARAQLLEASARRQAIAHLAVCEACADRFAEQQELTAAVRATTKSLAGEGASAHVEQSLRRAFRQRTVPKTTPAFSLTNWMWQWPKPAWLATVAVLLLVLAGLVWQWSSDGSRQETAILPHLPSTPSTSVQENLDTSSKPSTPASQSRPKHQFAGERRRAIPMVRSNAISKEEITTEFIVLANESELVPLESVQVLRVELPASTLISMGLPITAEDVSKPVLADLLVGQDGMARAIRFVRLSEANDAGLSQQLNNK